MKGKNIHIMREQRGVVLIVAMLVMAILSVMGLAFLMTARTEDAIAVNYRNHTSAFYAAEAGLESGVSSLKSLLGATPTPTDAQLAGLVSPALTDPSYAFDAFQVQRVRTTPPFSYTTTLTGGAYNGLFGQTTDYVVAASVQGPRGSRARLTQKVQFVGIPLFQFGIFYGRGVDLDIYPGPKMTFSGRIHANSNIYLRANKGLQFDSYVTAVGKVSRDSKNAPGVRKNNPEIKDASGNYQTLNFDHDYDYDFSNPWAESDWKNAALSTFGGRVQDGAMGVQEIIPPIPDAFYDPNNADKSSHLMIEKGSASDTPELKDARLYYQADLRIVDDKAYDKAGNGVKLNSCKDAKNQQAVRKETFYDAREQMDMQVTQVDVGALIDCGVMPKNGILYASPKPGSPNKGDAVRLVNGEKLPSQGLTVVSDTPLYIQGDYNTKNKVPAAVLADAVTVLSNAWGDNDYDKKGKDKVENRPAAETTVNAAFATGPNKEATVGDANGGVQNLIRFLEDWKQGGGANQKALNYSGSLVAMWHSLLAPGDFYCCAGGYYQPPKRNWGYDTLFNTNPPPGTPMGIIITRGQWSEG